MTETVEVPVRDCTFTARPEDIEVFVAASAADGKPASPRFKILGYSGGMFHKHGRWGDLVIDLDGITVGKQRGPVLLDHDSQSRVGFSESITIDHQNGLVVSGTFLKSTPASKQVLDEAREGYPWQASISVLPTRAPETVARGGKVKVNGREFTFPDGGTIFRETRFREVSFVALGADDQTSAEALSKAETVSVPVLSAPTEPVMADKQEVAQSAPPPLTRERLKAEHPEVYSAAFADGIAAERSRVTEIFNAAPDVARDIALKVVKGGDSIVDALKLFLEDGRRLKVDALSAIKAAADQAVGTGKDTQTQTFATPEDKAKAEFAAMPHALRQEYGDVESYVAFQQAKAANAVAMVGKVV